jgi:YD repeat-containing protein
MFDAECRLVPSRLPPGAETHFPCDADGRLSPTAFPIVFE